MGLGEGKRTINVLPEHPVPIMPPIVYDRHVMCKLLRPSQHIPHQVLGQSVPIVWECVKSSIQRYGVLEKTEGCLSPSKLR